jgi:hypothetical protein
MKTDIDPDFPITEKMREWAAIKVPRVDIDLETEKFIDYWLGHGKRMASWEATWRNWMRRAPDMGGCLKAFVPANRKPQEVTEEQLQKDREQWQRDMERLGVRVIK